MFDEKSFEGIKNLNFKLENELKVKIETEKHLIYENESLFEENQRLEQSLSKEKLDLSKCISKIRTLKGHIDDMSHLKSENEELSQENKKLKKDLDEQIKINKEHNRLKPIQVESPSGKIRQIEYKYKSQIEDLNNNVKTLKDNLDSYASTINNLKAEADKDREFFMSKIENYKEMLQDAKCEKEEIESELMALQSEFDKPDFDRQGNNLYAEVEDRRIQAEKMVLEYQREYQHLRDSNADLRTYLERAFDAYSELKEEELSVFKRDIVEENDKLKRHNEMLTEQCDRLNDLVMNKISNFRSDTINESVSMEALYLQLKINVSKTKLLKEDTEKSNFKAEQAHKKLTKLLKEMDWLTKENAQLKTKIEKYEARLEWFDRIIPKEKMDEYEKQQKKVEEMLVEKAKTNRKSREYIPPQVFGKQYQLAKFSDTLLFDHYGVPIKNKLTRRIMEKNKVEENIEECANIEGLVDDTKPPIVPNNYCNTNTIKTISIDSSDKENDISSEPPECMPS